MSKIPTQSDLAATLEQTIVATENLLDLRITIHDLKEAFVDQQQVSLLAPTRKWHTHPICKKVHDARCIDHCLVDVNHKASQTSVPFTHFCWKQMIEIAVGIYDDSQHVATLFAGSFKPAVLRRSVDLRWEKEHQQLKIADENHLQSCGKILHVLGIGLLSLTKQSTSQEQPSDRKSQIQRWLRDSSHNESTLEDLASMLFLSTSRTSHLVSQLFGQPFRQLIQQKRLQHAKHLLLTTDQNTQAIADAIGMQSPYHFNRAFKKMFGIPPGRFRKTSRDQA